MLPLPRADDAGAVLAQYNEIVQQYRANTRFHSTNNAPPVLTDAHGFAVGGPSGSNAFNQMLGERHSGFDKLFYTLVMGIVEDPDYALRKDARIYERMMRDPQIYYCLKVRKVATAGLSWTIGPPERYAKDSTALELAGKAEARLKQIPKFSELLDNMLDALLPGLSVNELSWKLSESNEYIISHHWPLNKDRVLFDKDGKMRLRQPLDPTIGLPVPPYKYITHSFNITDGSWMKPDEAGYVFYGKGLADTPLYHYFYFKVTALRFFLKGLERYGNPFKIFYSGAGNAALANRLGNIMTALQNDSVVGIPGKKGEVNVDLAHGNNTGGIMFIKFIEYIDRLITRAILLQELMTEMPASGSGSYALGQVHQSVFAQVAATDRLLLEDTLDRTLMTYDAQLNTPNVKKELWPKFQFKANVLGAAEQHLKSASAAIEIGLDISESQLRELTGYREPLQGEAVLSAQRLMQMKMELQSIMPEQDQQDQQDQQGQQGQKALPQKPKNNARPLLTRNKSLV